MTVHVPSPARRHVPRRHAVHRPQRRHELAARARPGDEERRGAVPLSDQGRARVRRAARPNRSPGVAVARRHHARRHARRAARDLHQAARDAGRVRRARARRRATSASIRSAPGRGSSSSGSTTTTCCSLATDVLGRRAASRHAARPHHRRAEHRRRRVRERQRRRAADPGDRSVATGRRTRAASRCSCRRRRSSSSTSASTRRAARSPTRAFARRSTTRSTSTASSSGSIGGRGTRAAGVDPSRARRLRQHAQGVSVRSGESESSCSPRPAIRTASTSSSGRRSQPIYLRIARDDAGVSRTPSAFARRSCSASPPPSRGAARKGRDRHDPQGLVRRLSGRRGFSVSAAAQREQGRRRQRVVLRESGVRFARHRVAPRAGRSEAQSLYRQADSIAFADAPMVFLYFYNELYAVQPWIKHFVPPVIFNGQRWTERRRSSTTQAHDDARSSCGACCSRFRRSSACWSSRSCCCTSRPAIRWKRWSASAPTARRSPDSRRAPSRRSAPARFGHYVGERRRTAISAARTSRTARSRRTFASVFRRRCSSPAPRCCSRRSSASRSACSARASPAAGRSLRARHRVPRHLVPGVLGRAAADPAVRRHAALAAAVGLRRPALSRASRARARHALDRVPRAHDALGDARGAGRRLRPNGAREGTHRARRSRSSTRCATRSSR